MIRTTNRSTRCLTTGILLFILAAIMICYGTYSHIQHKALINACTETTTGTIEDIQTVQISNGKSGGDKHIEYSAVVTFEAPSGQQYSFTTEHRKQNFNIGTNVTVKYDPNDPDQAYTTEFNPDPGKSLAGGGVFVLLIGAALTFIGIKKRIY